MVTHDKSEIIAIRRVWDDVNCCSVYEIICVVSEKPNIKLGEMRLVQ